MSFDYFKNVAKEKSWIWSERINMFSGFQPLSDLNKQHYGIVNSPNSSFLLAAGLKGQCRYFDQGVQR